MQETMDLKGGRVLVKGDELGFEFGVDDGVGEGCFKAR
jgi:hypothetical protein